MKSLAHEIYDYLLDMDYADYEETKTDEIKHLEEDLMLLESKGNGTLLNAIQMLIESK